MLRRSSLTIMLALPLTAAMAVGQSTELEIPGDSLSQYIAYGLSNNPGLAAEYNRYEAALQRIPQIKALPDPKVTATHFFEAIQTRTGPQETQLFVNQTIPWFGKLRLRGSVASAEAEAINHGYQGEVLNLAELIGVSYYNYAYLGKATQITNSVTDLIAALRDTVEAKVQGGDDLAPLLRLEVELARNQDLLQSLQKQRLSVSAELRALLGMPDDTQPLPFPSLTYPGRHVFDRKTVIASLLQDNPELKQLESRIYGASESLRLSKLSPLPDPTLGAGILDTGSAFSSSTVGSGDDPWAVQISFSIPLWTKKYKAERMEAEAKYEMAKSMLSERENVLLAQVDAEFQKLAENQERLELYDETLLPKARQALEVTETSYKADRASVLDLIDSERTLLEVERGYWKTVTDYYGSLIRLRTLTGKSPHLE